MRHWGDIEQVLMYLKSSLDLGLTIVRTSCYSIQQPQMRTGPEGKTGYCLQATLDIGKMQ